MKSSVACNMGGALFAVWPAVYATAFSGFILTMMITLALFLRPVGFDYRSKLESQKWRNIWDWALVLSGIVPPIIFGVAFGNLLVCLSRLMNFCARPTTVISLVCSIH